METPESYLTEIFRVLKPGGKLVLGVRDRTQMDEFPLDKNIFSTYTLDEMEELLTVTGFSSVHSMQKQDDPLTSYCIVGTKR